MKENNAPAYRQLLCRLPLLLLIPLGLLLPQFFAAHRDWIESAYCTGIYPAISRVLFTLTGWCPFSLAELLLYLLAVGLPLLIAVQLARTLARRIPLRRFLSLLLSLGIAGGAVLNLFYVTWGLNYLRTPLAVRMALPVQARTEDELAAVTALLAKNAAQLRLAVSEDKNGVFTAALSPCFAKLPEAYEALLFETPELAGYVPHGPLPQARRVLWSKGLSRLGIAGIYIGLTGEPNVNVDQPPLLIPQGAAHEMAHALGIASEDEAEFAAFLACMRAEDPAIRYSATMNMLLRCGNALYAANAVRFRALRGALYSDGMRRDLSDYSRYWDAFEGPIQEAAERANDRYLKHNEQQSGVRSYGESVDLLLALYALRGEAALSPCG